MKNNKLITLVLALLVCFSLVLTASATSDNKNLTLAVEANPSTVVYGNTIKVSVMANENPGIRCVNFQITWDAGVLELEKYETTGSAFEGITINERSNKLIVTIGNPQDALNPAKNVKITANGLVMEMTFKVVATDDADVKTKINISNPSIVGLDCNAATMNAEDVKPLDVAVLSTTHVHKSEKPATCTEPELCAFCGFEMAPVKAHTPGAAATCTTNQVCTVCNAELAPAGKHNLVLKNDASNHWKACTKCDYVEQKDAHIFWNSICNTCGYGCEHVGGTATCTELAKCTKCYMRYGQLAAHTPGAAATCTTAQVCTACSVELAPAKGHTPGAAATCTTAQVCTVCSAELAPAAGHTPGAAATCTSEQKCTVCQAVLAEKVAHTPGAAATCTSEQKCTVCQTVLAEKKAHTPGAAATCTSEQKCTACQTVLANKKAHTPGAAATCTSEQKCTVCQTVIKEKLAHDLEEVAAKAATCGAIGWNKYEKCKNCDYTTYAEIAATGAHTFGEWTVLQKATTKAAGEQTHTCSVCNLVENETIPMLDAPEIPWALIIVLVVLVAAFVVVIIIIKKKK